MNSKLIVISTVYLIAAIMTVGAGLFSWNLAGPDPNASIEYRILMIGAGMFDMYLVGWFGGYSK